MQAQFARKSASSRLYTLESEPDPALYTLRIQWFQNYKLIQVTAVLFISMVARKWRLFIQWPAHRSIGSLKPVFRKTESWIHCCLFYSAFGYIYINWNLIYVIVETKNYGAANSNFQLKFASNYYFSKSVSSY